MIVLLLKSIVIIFIVAISSHIFESLAKDEDLPFIKRCILVIIVIILDIIGVSEVYKTVFEQNTKPIPENEQAYHLDDNVPDKEIEVNGHKYILADE